MKSLKGRHAVITGGAGGIGVALARELGRSGASLCLVDRESHRLEEVVAELQLEGISTEGWTYDLSDRQAVSELARRLIAAPRLPDLLVNNAGLAYYGSTLEMTSDQWDAVLGVNLEAPVQLTRYLLPTLLERGQAHVVNMSSMCAFHGMAKLAAYCLTKAAVLSFSEALRHEYSRFGLGVTAVCPGFVDTGFFQSKLASSRHRDAAPPAWLCTTPERVARRTIRAIRRNRRLVVTTPLAHALLGMKRFAPGLLDAALAAGRRRPWTPATPELRLRRAG